MKITISGASGFLGRRLSDLLRAEGHEIRILSRTARGTGEFPWNTGFEEPPLAALEGAQAVIHLAGEPVGQRWTPEVKLRIWNSRVQGTRNLVAALAKLNSRPAVLLSASAVGYYGDRGSEILTESSKPGQDFLAGVCRDWEAAAMQASGLGIRTVRIRMAAVLGRGGGALEKMLLPFRAGLGGPIAGGGQWMSWIHQEDVERMFLWALAAPEVSGAINATSPNPITNKDFTMKLGAALRRPAVIPVPEFALRLMYGEMASVVTCSQRVIPQAAVAAGFQFRYPEVAEALRTLV